MRKTNIEPTIYRELKVDDENKIDTTISSRIIV
jgi:hypothetical protein